MSGQKHLFGARIYIFLEQGIHAATTVTIRALHESAGEMRRVRNLTLIVTGFVQTWAFCEGP